MAPILRYLVIMQPTGLPLYAQSFDFSTDHACESFNSKLETDADKRELLGGMFQALSGLAYEVIDDKLQIINLGFESFRIMALIVENYLFLGIFESQEASSKSEMDEILVTLDKIATIFLTKYPKEILEATPVRFNNFYNFTEEINNLKLPVQREHCRNCIEKCKDYKKGCLPHMVYFNKLENNLKSPGEN